MQNLIPLAGLFFLAFINQVFLPAPVDFIILAMAAAGLNPGELIIVNVIGQTLGSTTDFLIARYGIDSIPWVEKKEKKKGFKRARKFFEKYGRYTLIFSDAPFMGKFFPFLAGLLELPIYEFFVFYLLGKAIYYSAFYLILVHIF